ncbi:MAG: hypothetical protein M3Q23_06025 [Actinomycetota bacterium]|nr:hypothetical protein [Actinomycetota bacterium]
MDEWSTKYARIEREWRFLLAELPDHQAVLRVRRVIDRYFPGTALRLRRLEETVDGEERLEYELTQKLGPGEPGPPRPLITNLYLSQAAYDLLARLPGDDLSKTRYSVAPLAIGGIDVFDVFEPPLDGLVLAESEFETDEAMAAFRPPEFVLAEVTNEPRFSGAHLARTGRAVLRAVLAEFGIRIDLP